MMKLIGRDNEYKVYKDALLELLIDFRGSLFVTFAFNREITFDAAVRKIECFQAMIDCKVLGSRWLKLKLDRTQYIMFAENVATNLHFHASFQVPYGKLKFMEVADAIWGKLMPAGDLDIQEIYNAQGLAKYITKQIHPGSSYRLWPSPNASYRP